ncbi:MAG: right-handed parallel beta-helix repeat-containing protein [Phycisphaerae bacterium]|nr:right-handed parallel beta-helix repeat-containing protein [Phycisphaerae bacterium]
MNRFFGVLLAMTASLSSASDVVIVTRDNTVIDRSCTVRIPQGAVIEDPDGDGVIHVQGNGIIVQFEKGSVLRGAAEGTSPDGFRGIGVRIDNAAGATLRGAVVRGYKVGVQARGCDGLTIDGADLSDNFRQRLHSTPEAEAGSDWLWPHQNDGAEWRKNYGAALCIETSRDVTVRGVRVRRGQNGIILDRVTDSRIFDNDCSFLSGWGIALWRSSGNLISRNAVDFCVRGHSEGVYNRGQDSAGFLVFEQCHRNTFIENSATHGGDGFFGFAGKEAIGDIGRPADPLPIEQIGCNENLLIGNDFSYAPAHGIEMTFSRGNRFIGNRIVENAICGVWGGYSNDTLIADNEFVGNGGMAYGLECGGVNIEHGSGNVIRGNRFTNNRAAVHLWWDNDEGLLKLPGVKAIHRGVTDNAILDNTIEINPDHPFTAPRQSGSLVGLRLRDTGQGNVRGTRYIANRVRMTDPRATEFELSPGIEVSTTGDVEPIVVGPVPDAIGDARPVGARATLRGRDRIIMGEWGPWDHESPMVRPRAPKPGRHEFEYFGPDGRAPRITCDAPVTMESPADGAGPMRIIVTQPVGADVSTYSLSVSSDDVEWTTRGTMVRATWECVAFPWSIDPREDYAGWTAERLRVPRAVVSLPALDFKFGSRGPRDMPQFADEKATAPGGDRFGIVAVSTINLPAGRWKFWTRSDDGVRVKVAVAGESTTVIDNWTWHGPTLDTGIFHHKADGPATVTVEYFEIDGHAVLEAGIEPAE